VRNKRDRTKCPMPEVTWWGGGEVSEEEDEASRILLQRKGVGHPLPGKDSLNGVRLSRSSDG